ncbi:hypothetical protein [Streptomyces acidicola]|uniref:hypothetical protein n=1 Tax=Streptomyces acidicola TaxID=2596892 RepID=UPI003814E7A3
MVDSVVDKAYAMAARAGGKKRDTDLFDLLWALGEHPGLETALVEELVKRRGAAYAARPPVGGKPDVTAQFVSVLSGVMGTKRARESLVTAWRRFGATPEDVQRLHRTLADLADVFRAGSGPFRSLVVTAGNFTGDNFGLATALLLNPKLHVGVMTGPRHPDQVGPFLRKTVTAPVHDQYAKAVARLDANTGLSAAERADRLARLTAQRDAELRAQEARIHTFHSNDPHGLYTQAANGYGALPYSKMSPAIPVGLRSTRFQKPTWYATSEVANRWDGQGRAKVRTAWGLDTPDTRRVREFLEARGVPEKGPHVVLWSRLSSRQEGEPHPQHDTSTTGLRQIIDQLPPGTNVIIAGDSSNNGALEELADEYPNVHDLTEFWTGDDWQQAFPGGTREDQFQVFDHLSQVSDGGLKHLGFRSGNLEAYALIGHQVRYLEETGNRQGKRMETWHAPDIGYQRITLNKVPTLAGQWVVANAAVTGKENPVPWWSERDGTRDRDRLKTKALAKFDIANTPAQRGFAPLDLQAIGSYLGFSGPATFSPAFPTSGQWNSPAPRPTSAPKVVDLGPATATSPRSERLALTSQDHGVYKGAIGYLTGLDADESRRVNAWAIERVAVDHYLPVSLEPTAEDRARQRLQTDFVSMVAFTYATRGADAAAALSLRLAHEYGTRRTIQARGGAPGDATVVQAAQMRYLQEADRFEDDLAGYLGEREDINAEFGKMVQAAWRFAWEGNYNPDFRGEDFGFDEEEIPGAVGQSVSAVHGVVVAGNLRERVAFLRQGLGGSYRLFDLLGYQPGRPDEITAERPDRVPAETMLRFEERLAEIEESDMSSEEIRQAYFEARATLQSRTRASDVRPPLSQTEQEFLGHPEFLPWSPANKRHAIREGSAFQRRSAATGGRVWTGTSGSAYHLMLLAVMMNERWGLNLNLGLIRAGVFSTMTSQRHHTFHEVMRGSQLALNQSPDHDPELDYVDTWSRYLHFAPLSEEELRSVANGGQFPHEHAMEILRSDLTRADSGGKGKARAERPLSAGDAPESVRLDYNAALAFRSRAAASFADVALSPPTNEGPSHETRVTAARARLEHGERWLAEATEELADVGLDITLHEPIATTTSDISSAMGGLSLEPSTGSGLFSFPAPDQWNSPPSRSDTDWNRDAVRRRDLVDRGRPFAITYFSDADWKPRERPYQRLPELTHMVVWSGDGPGRPSGELLPVPGRGPGERFFFARHGRPGGLSEAESRDLAKGAAASGYRDVYLLPCYTPGVAGSRPEVNLDQWARQHRKTVHEVLGRSTVTESPDGRFGPVLWHVWLDGTGSTPAMRSHHPDGTVTETWAGTGTLTRGITFPARSLWNTSVSVTASPRAVERLKGLWDRAVERQGVQRLTVTIDGSKVTARDLMAAVLEHIGAADRADDFVLSKPKVTLAAGGTHKVLLSFNADGQRGTVSREIRVESRSVPDPTPQPSTSQRPAFDPDTTPAENRRKLDVGREFGGVINGLIRNDPRMRDLRHPLVLSGAAQINLVFDSPRPMNDLDYRLTTPYVRQYEDIINRALVRHFPSAPGAPPNVLQRDSHDPRALSGRINGVDVTIGPSSHAYENTSTVEGIVVPSLVDSVVDKAYALAARAGGRKRDTDLFDLLWALGEYPGLEATLAEELVKRRGAAYAARPPADGKADVTAQFAHVLSSVMSGRRSRESLGAQWQRFGATRQDVERLHSTLADLADVFRAGSGPFRALIVTAGNFTGDNFGLAAALLLNPKLHVGVMTGSRTRDQVGPFLRKTVMAPVHAEYRRAVARLDANPALSRREYADALGRLNEQRDIDLRAQETRVHTLYSADPHGLYMQAANGYAALPHAEMRPALPRGLRSTRLQKPTSYATAEVANHWDSRGRERAKIRTAWGLDAPHTRRVREFLEARGVPERGPHVVLWSRLGSRQEGEPHPQHDTSTTGLRQLVERLPRGTSVIIAGDRSKNGALRELAERYDNVHDLTEFWTGADWRQAFPGATREDQFQVFDHLSQVSDGDLKHLGFRSGNLEAYALIGHQVRYLEETGNRQGKRMKPWHIPAIGYQRITLNKVPTLAGQWVVANATVTGNETSVPWWSLRDGTPDRDRMKTRELARFDIANTPAQRGFDPLDLQAIGSYLGFSGRIRQPENPPPPRVVARQVTDRDGRWIGEAVFDQADHELRAPALRQAGRITEYTQWERTSSGGVSGVQRTMPVTDGSSAFWFGHGDPTANMAEFGRFADRAVESGLTSITVVACSTRSGVTASAARLRPLVERKRLAVHLVPARIALVPGREGRPGRMHVDVDRRGRSAGFVSLFPGVPEPVSTRGARIGHESVSSRHYPADAYWNAPPSATLKPRFPQLYAGSPAGGPWRYGDLSQEYETALRKVLSAHQRINTEVINTLNALFVYYEPHFQAEAFKLFASRRSPLSAAEQFGRLTDRKSDATLDERIEAFADAVFGNPDHPEALGKLWARKPDLKPDGLSGVPDAATPYSAEARQQAREYGYRFAKAPAETVTHLMRMRRMLNVPGGHPMFFRDALIAWGLRSHSLAEVLAATQKAGIRDETEPSRPVDAARLYAWSDAQLDPHRVILTAIPASLRGSYARGTSVWNSLRQPHERWFQEAWQSFDAFTREKLESIATMAALEGAPAQTMPAGTPAPPRRRALMELWERQGVTTGVENLQAGHLLGLYLALGPDRHLLPVRPAGSTVFAQGEAPPPLPEPTARRLVLRAWEGKDDYPALFLADSRFGKQLALAERARKDGRSEKELRVHRDKLIKLAVERTELLAPVLGGYEELASEAAERLIPAHRRAWFGEWDSGPVDGPHTFGNERGAIHRRPRHIVSVDRRTLLDGLVASDEDHTGEHLVLYEVLKSTAREVAPFLPKVDHTARGTALYPEEMEFRYQGHRIERDERHRLSHVVVTLKEAPKPLSPDVWDREFQSHTLRARNGTQIGSALMGSNDWVIRKDSVIGPIEAGSYRTYDDESYRFSDQEHPVPWKPGRVGWLNVHSSGKDFVTPSRYGTKRVSGAQVGAYARQLLRSLGLPDIPIVYVACSAARSHGVGTVAAQAVADWSKQVGFAGPTTIAHPTVGVTPKTESGQPIAGGVMALKTTADDPAPRFTRFEPRPLTDPVGPRPFAQQGAWAEGLYARSAWKEYARGYEVALARKLAGDPEALDAARDAVEAAGGTRPTSTDITEVMLDFFARALSQTQLRDFHVQTAPRSSYHNEYLARGVRITREGHALPELLFEEYADLADPSYPQLLAFRKAVVAWLVGTNMPYAHSLHEVVRASATAHVGFDDIADTLALAGDGAHLYLWAEQALDDGATGAALPPPMYTHYRALTENLLTPTVTGDGRIPAGIVRVLEGKVVDHGNVTDDDVPRKSLSERLDALADWRGRHRGSLLKLLGDGHITALHLLSGPDEAIFDLWRNAEKLTKTELRKGLRDIVETAFDGRRSFPRMLMRDSGFRTDARAANSLFRKMDKAKSSKLREYRSQLPQHKSRVLKAVDGLVGTVYEDMPLHLEVAAQGLKRLPAVGESVFWAVHESGPLTGSVGEQPPGELHSVWVRELHKAWLRKDFAMKMTEKGGGRIRVFEVEKTRHAVDVSPIARNPAVGQTYFRQETLLEVRSREIREFENEDGGVVLYEHVVLREVDEQPRRAAVEADRSEQPRRGSTRPAAPAPEPIPTDTKPGPSGKGKDATPPPKSPGSSAKTSRPSEPSKDTPSPQPSKGAKPSSKGPEPSDTAPAMKWYRVKGAGGRGALLAQFTPEEWSRREPAYRRLADGPTNIVRWVAGESGHSARQGPMEKVFDGGVVFYARHGSAEGPDLGRMRKNLDLGSAEHVMLLECGKGNADAESSNLSEERVERNRRVARELGKTVWWPQAEVAVTPSPDGSSAQMHLREDAEGKRTTLLYSVRGGPAQYAFQAMLMPEPVPEGTRYPRGADWNAPAQIKPVEPRFPQLYAPNPSGGRNRYEELSREYEVALRSVLSVHAEVNYEVVDTLKALFEYYEPHFQSDTFKLFASRQRPESAPEQFARLTDDNADVTLDERMDAFADAVFGNPDFPEVLGKLWARKPELKPDGLSGLPDIATPYSAEARDRARAYGYRFAKAPAEVVTYLMRVRRMLNVPQGRLMFFRDALIAWGLRSHSLAEVLAATQKAGVRDEVEPSRPVDAARLYAWSDAQLDPRRAIGSAIFESFKSKYGAGNPVWNSLRQPHERWFHESWGTFDTETRGALEQIATMTQAEGSKVPDVVAGYPALRRRRALMELWERQGITAGVENLQAGHLLGLYLALGPDRRLIKVRPAGSTVFAQGEAPPLLPEPTARKLVVEAWEKTGHYPALFRTDPAFRQQLAKAERARKDGRSEKELRARRDELIELAVEWTERHAQDFSGYEELASEAVERLIPAHQRAWFGEWVSGSLDGPHTFGNAKGVIRKRPLHSVSLNRSALLDGLLASNKDHTGEYLVLYEVLKSSAREVAPFLPTVRHTDRGKAMYPGVVAFTYRGYRVERDERTGQSYAVVTLTEIFQPLSPEMWEREFQTRAMREPDGTEIGTAFVGSNDWAGRAAGAVKATHSSTYRTYQGDFEYSDQEHPVPWQLGQVGWLYVHGSGTFLGTPSRYGAKRVSGAQVGAYAKQLLRAFGSPDIPFVLAACSAGRSHAVGTAVAQAVADWSKHVDFAGPSVLAHPNPGGSLATESGKDISDREFFAFKNTPDYPAARFTRFEPRSVIDPVRPETFAEQGAWAEGLYRLQEWTVHARDYEIALAKKLAGDREALDAAVHALQAAGGQPRANADVTEVMLGFFVKALPQRSLQDFFGILPPIGSFTDEQFLRGVRITRQGLELPQLVFQEYVRLATPSYPQQLAFRKAVVAWLVGTTMPYAHSLHEVLLSSQLSSGLDDIVDRIAVAGDAAHVYMWADRHLGPDGGTTPVGLPLPMEATYRSLTDQLLTPTVTGDGRIPEGIVRVLEGKVVDHESVTDRDVPRDGLSGRLDALADWRGRHRGSLLKLLGGAEITALHLLSGPDSPIFPFWRQAEPPTRTELRKGLREIVKEAFDTRGPFPWVMMRSSGFRSEARVAMSHFRQMDTARSSEKREYRRLLAEDRASLLSAVDSGVVDAVHAEMPMHMAMAAQGLKKLPPVGESVFWAVRDPEPLTGKVGDEPSGELHSVWAPELHEALLRKDVAMKIKGGGRIRLFEVENAQNAVDVSPLAWNPAVGQTYFRQETLLEVRSREIREFENEDGGVVLYEHVVLREADHMPRRAAVEADRSQQPRRASTAQPSSSAPGSTPSGKAPEPSGKAPASSSKRAEPSKPPRGTEPSPKGATSSKPPKSTEPSSKPSESAKPSSKGEPSSKGPEPSGTAPAMKWYRVKGAGGRGALLAQFTPEEWSRREPAYRLLAAGPKDIVRWVGHEPGRTARQGPLEKVFDGGVVFYARHASPEMPDLGRMRKNLDLGSSEHVMLLECGTDNADAESSNLGEERVERNRRVARELGKTVWWPQADVAVTPSPDGSSAQMHLREDAEGKRTTLLYSVRGGPAQYAFQAMLMPEPVPEGTRYPRAADWNTGLSTATVGIGVRPVLGKDASALLLRRPAQPPRSWSNDSEPLSPTEIDSRTAQTKYGISEDDYAKFRRISQSRNVVIDVLPGNPAAPKWRAEGAIPKPSAVKAKSINETDVPLGADPETVGLIGFFEPRLPGRGEQDDATWEAVLARYNERRYEYDHLSPVMRRLTEAGVIAVENGVVYGVKDGRRNRMSGDEDIYDLTNPDGTRVSLELHDEIIREMEDSGTAVTHGGLQFWRPPSPFSQSIRDKIVAKHTPGGEPLVRFAPANPFAGLAWDTTATAGQGTDGTGAGRSASLPDGQIAPPAQPARRMRLHPYLEAMRAAGGATFHDLEGTDWVSSTITSLTSGGNAETITEQLALRTQSFLGGGRPFQVLGGDGAWYDVTLAVGRSPRERRPLVTLPAESPSIRASRALSAPATLEALAEEPGTANADDAPPPVYPERKVAVDAKRARTRHGGFALKGAGMILVPTPVPALLAGASGALNIPVRRVSTTAATKQSVTRRDGMFNETTVDVPRLVEFVLTVKKAGVPASSTFRGEGRVTANVPVSHLMPDGTPYRSAEPRPVSADLARDIASADSLVPLAVSGNGSPAAGRGALFGTITGVVHPALTAPGSPGRDVAFDASTADGVQRSLLRALSGWVDSGELRGKDDSVHGSYRYRATITDIAPSYDLGEPWPRSDQQSKSEQSVEVGRERGAEIAVGPAFGAGLMGSGPLVRAWINPLFGAQRRRFSSFATTVAGRQGADVMGDRVLYEARVRLDYEGSGPLSPEMRAGRAAPHSRFTVTTWFSLRADEAAFLGLPLPAGLSAKSLVKHPGVERTLLAGPRGFSTAMSRFDTTRLVAEIEKVFAQDERLKGLLPKFGAENRPPSGLIGDLSHSTRATADGDRALKNHQTLTTTLSDTNMRARKDVLFTQGVVAVLRGKGRAHNKYALVRVKGLDSGPGQYLGDTDDWKVRSGLELSTGVLSGAAGNQVFGIRTGVAGKPIPGHLYVTGSGALTFSSARARQGGPKSTNKSGNNGAEQTALHRTVLGFDVEITLVERPRAWKRSTTPGLPGRQAPEVQVIARTGDVSGRPKTRELHVDPVPVRLTTPVPFTLTPRQRDLLNPPGPTRRLPVPPLRGISTMYDPRWATPSDGEKRLREWVYIEDIGDGSDIQQLALGLLAGAAGDDTALSTAGLDPALWIEDRLSPGAVAVGLGRGGGVSLADDLYYKRRIGSLTGALGQRSELVNPVVIDVVEGPETTNGISGGHQVATSKSGSRTLAFAATVGGAGNMNPTLWTWGGLSGSYGWGRTRSREQSMSGSVERVAKTKKGARLVLAQADLKLFQAAEVSVSAGPDGTRSGGILRPKRVVLWLTEKQARDQGLGDQLDARLRVRDAEAAADAADATDAVAPAETSSEAPASQSDEQSTEQPASQSDEGLRLDGDGPLGLGLPEGLPDFGQLLSLLRVELVAARGPAFAAALLPERLLSDRYRNTQRLAAVLDRVAAPALMSGAMDGGVPVELFINGESGRHAYTARFSVRRGAGVFHDRPDEPRGIEYGTAMSVAESNSEEKKTGPGLDVLTLPTPALSGSNAAAGALQPGTALHFEGISPQSHGAAKEYQHSVNAKVSADDAQVRLRVPFTATLALYDHGLSEYRDPIASVDLPLPSETGRDQEDTQGRVLGEVDDDGNLLPDDAGETSSTSDTSGSSVTSGTGAVDARPFLLFRVPEADLVALAHVSPPRARTLGPDDQAASLAEWRSKGVRLPREAQANTFQGAEDVRRGLAALAGQVGGEEDFHTTGRSTSYTTQEAISTEWLTGAVPPLVARGLPLPEAHVPAILRNQDLDVMLYARLGDGEVLGPVGDTAYEVVDGGEAGRPALEAAKTDTRGDQAGAWQGGVGWVRYGLNDVYDARADFALTGESSAHTAQGNYGTTNWFAPSGPSVLVQFKNVDLRMVATLKQRLGHMIDVGESRGTRDLALEHPVVIRMLRKSAAQLLAGGGLTDPRGHIGAAETRDTDQEIRSAEGRLIGRAIFRPSQWNGGRRELYPRLPDVRQGVVWRGPEGAREYAYFTVPISDPAGTFFLAGNGGGPATRAGLLRETVREFAKTGATEGMVLVGSPVDLGPAAEESQGSTVGALHAVSGEVAVTPRTATEPDLYHLLPGSDGAPSSWLIHRGDGTVETHPKPQDLQWGEGPRPRYPDPYWSNGGSAQGNGTAVRDRPRDAAAPAIPIPMTPVVRDDPATPEEDAPPEEPAAPYQRTDTATALLHGTAFGLHAVEGPGDAFGEALARTLRGAGVEPPAADRDLRGWAVGRVTEADLADVALPPLDRDRDIEVVDLTEAGVKLKPGQDMEAVLRGGNLAARELKLTPLDLFRLLARSHDLSVDPAATAAVVDAVAATVLARELGVAIAVVGPDGGLTWYGPSDGRPVLLVRDGDRYLAGVPDVPAGSVSSREGAP